MDTRLNAFWSYSRATDDTGSRDLYEAMRATLRDPISLWGMLDIYRDVDRANGISVGALWPQDVIAAVARSTLFFWVQSPRWLRADSMCSFEFEMFCDRVKRVARHFVTTGSEQTAERLLEALVIPVRLFEMEPSDWSLIDERIRQRFEHEWNQRQVHPALDLARHRLRGTPPTLGYALNCIDAAQPIAKRFGGALAELKIDLPTLNAFIAADSADFHRQWSRAYETRFDDELQRQCIPARDADLAAQQRLAGGRGHHMSRWPSGLSFVLVPDASGERGFWASAAPLSNRFERVIAGSVPDRGQVQRGPGGFLLCSAAGAVALHDTLRALGAALPEAAQAGRLQAIFAKGRDHALRLGFQAMPDGFWFVDEHGVNAHGADASPLRPLLLVAATS